MARRSKKAFYVRARVTQELHDEVAARAVDRTVSDVITTAIRVYLAVLEAIETSA